MPANAQLMNRLADKALNTAGKSVERTIEKRIDKAVEKATNTEYSDKDKIAVKAAMQQVVLAMGGKLE